MTLCYQRFPTEEPYDSQTRKRPQGREIFVGSENRSETRMGSRLDAAANRLSVGAVTSTCREVGLVR
jgi:hypothetical protein